MNGSVSAADDLATQALHHYQAGQFERAEALCTSAVHAAPDRSFLWHLSGLIASARGDDRASARLRASVAFDPDNHIFLFNAVGHELRWAHRVVALAPDFAAGWARRGDVGGEPTDWQRALVLDPALAEPWVNLGHRLIAAGQPALALAHYRHAVRLRPELMPAWAGLSRAAFDLGDLDQADQAFWSGQACNPDPVVRLAAESEAGIARADLDRAIRAFKSARDLDPGGPPSARAWATPRRRLIVAIQARHAYAFAADELSAASDHDVRIVDWTEVADGPADIYLYIATLFSTGPDADHHRLARIAAARPDVLRVTWAPDNHHGLYWNYRLGQRVDVYVPSHHSWRGYLSDHGVRLGRTVPLSTIQWTLAEIDMAWSTLRDLPRHDRLNGRFGYYPVGARRNRLVRALSAAGIDRADFGLLYATADHFAQSPLERFRQWRGAKISLCLPVTEDLPMRLFDALLAGQVPVVGASVVALDDVIAPALQRSLPIIRASADTVEAVVAARDQALAAFDAEGEAGALRRHHFARDGHLFQHRFIPIIDTALALGPA